MTKHPQDALFGAIDPLIVAAPCDHYAGTERFIEKALRLSRERPGSFDVTMDLEDGAAVGRESEQRTMVIDLLRSTQNTSNRAGVRIHDPRHPAWQSDIEELVAHAGVKLHHLTVPKVQGLDDVVNTVEALDRATRTAGTERLVPVHVLIETHGALADAFRIAAHPRVAVLDFGLMDFVSAHHGAIDRSAMRSPGQFEHPLLHRAKTRMVAAALAHGAVPAHNVTIDLDDPEQTRADATRAKQFGFLRMWSIHPSQIEPIVEAMRPSFEDALHAARVLLAGQAADWGPVRIDETLYDRASYRLEWVMLSRAHLAGVQLPEQAIAAFFSDGG